MLNRNIAGVIVFILVLSGVAFAGNADIVTKNVDTKVIDKSLGFTRYSVKLETMNYGDPVKVYIKVRALDIGGHELERTTLMATMQKYDTKNLTSSVMMKSEIADKIYRWEVDRMILI